MKYEIIGRFIELHEGLVEVNESQARRRSAMLTPISGGVYRIDNPVQFKVGEIIGLSYDPPKSLIEFMKPIEEVKETEIVEEIQAVEEVQELPQTIEIKVKQKHKK